MKLFGKHNKHIVATVIIFALITIIFPLVHIGIHLGATININFGLLDLFRNFDTLPQDTLDIPMGAAEISEDLALAIALPLLAYFLNLFFIVLTIPFLFTNKLKTLKIVFISMASILMIFVGVRISALPVLLNDHVGEMLTQDFGGFAAMLDFSDLLEINLGLGYWLMLMMLLSALVLLIVAKISDNKQKKWTNKG